MFRKSAAFSDTVFEAALFTEEDYVYRISFIYLKEESAALENVQEVAYRAWRGRRSLRDASYFKTWLTRITMNCAFKQQRASFQPLTVELSPTTSFEERLVDRLYLKDLLEISSRLNAQSSTCGMKRICPCRKSRVCLTFH
ncbi:sigma factor [Exiguobacterium sp.]|uniref:sigma factor n=1 Tax=Exiguobacterium sp. TaxID=44751 RepID=UPI00289F1145|nr:sigma factor [Exiguobacterium sp.]